MGQMESRRMFHRTVRSGICFVFSGHLLKLVLGFFLIIGVLGKPPNVALATETKSTNWSELTSQFAKPPAIARPWVYWFWKNGNITRDGITADLEAMHEVGIGGVILMEVSLSSGGTNAS